ncbi:MAG: glycosyltransferase family 2 protein [Myxococcales bacterium]|nr:glycosyltransferase family 2 protein [Myxococcales bacterium]
MSSPSGSPSSPSPRPTLSLVLPIYNEEAVIPELDRRLRAFFDGLPELAGSWEVVFVNDGSADASADLLGDLARNERRYRVLHFARNFGHQAAITAGLDRAEGDAVVVMDADLQDPPEVVRDMLARWREGFDVVYGVRSKRHGETLFKRATAHLFYRLMAMGLGVKIPADAGDFRLMSRPVVLTLRSLRERHRFMRGLVAWVGFRQTAVYYERPERFAGETKYPLRKMLRFALDGVTSFSTTPLRIATWLGAISGAAAVGIGVWALYIKLFTDKTVQGWTTLTLLLALTASAQMLVIGLLGEYVGRIYEEIKNRPLYIVARETGVDSDSAERR